MSALPDPRRVCFVALAECFSAASIPPSPKRNIKQTSLSNNHNGVLIKSAIILL